MGRDRGFLLVAGKVPATKKGRPREKGVIEVRDFEGGGKEEEINERIGRGRLGWKGADRRKFRGGEEGEGGKRKRDVRPRRQSKPTAQGEREEGGGETTKG